MLSDIEAVTGVTANIVNDAENADIIVGTIGKSAAVDSLITEGKLDVSEIEGQWEAFTLSNIDGTLVIAGADKRGTIYGIYDLSEKMGVSPWEWWADVTPSHSDAIYVSLPENGYTEGAPSVKYRGIFINQEYNLWNWAKSLDGDIGIGTETYKKIFELLLRLKANYLWPAMHEYTQAFNVNPENARLADEYGIVMGTSHCEMLLRNNMGELLDFQERWISEHPNAKLYMFKDNSLNADVAYDYTDVDAEGNPVDNKQFVEDYWRERVRANKDYESNFTIGMRGVHDGAWNPVSAKTDEEKIALLEEIIAKQREILSQEIGKPAEEIPQTFIPYKEILPLYNAGLEVPDDVTIMWTNDNYGHIRQSSNKEERQRSGGGGMYYHVSYFGRPSSVIWNGGTQLGLIKEEMTKAYDSGADTVWILNVGPLKGFENQTEYFLDLGRNIDKVRNISVKDYVKNNAKHYFDFNDEQAEEYAEIQCEFLELANSRRPDFMTQGLYSITSYGDEGQIVADRYDSLLKRSEALYNSLPDDKKPSFYELQLYAVKSANNIIHTFIGADKAALYKAQGRGAGVNKYAEESESAWAKITDDMNEYNTMLDGKWNNVVNPFQKKESGSWDIMRNWKSDNSTVVLETVDTLPYTEMGIAVENQQDINTAPVLEFSGYTKDVRFIDIFNRGTGSFDWKASADKDWIIFNKENGTVCDDDRIYAGIDWDSVPDGNSTAKITITRYIGENAVQSKTIDVTVNNDVKDLPEKTYAEANGYVSMEAEHYTRSTSKSSGESSLTDGVVTGSEPKLITNASDGVGVVAVYNQDGTLSSVQTSTNYSEGAYIFEKPIDLNADETVKGMVWSSFEEMRPIKDAYGLAEEQSAAVYEWQEQDDFGRSGTSMKLMPNTDDSISDNSVYLEYDIYFESTGTFNVDVYRMPTLNERGGMNFAVGIDESTPTVLEGCNKYYNNSNGTDKWGKGILNNSEMLTASVTVTEPGIHHLRLYGIDPGVTIDKMVITTGEKFDSYYGAPESYNTTYNNKAAEIPEPSTAATESTGDVTALFTPQLYTAGISLDGDAVTGVGIIKLADISNAHITVAAYDDSGIMLDSQTVTDDFSEVNINEKATIPVNFAVPQDTAEIQVIVYDGNETLNALSPVYATDVNSVSLMATYDNGTIEVRQDLGRYTGKEAICLITDADSGETVYIRQETVGENTFKTITTGELDSTYNVNIGVSGNGMVITEKAYTEKHIETDNPEKSETLYSWDFSEESQTASQGSNIPVLGGNAAYDSGNQAVKMTSTDKSGGKMSVTFDEPVKTVQGQEITVVSKIAYGREDGKHMDYTITDSNGNELLGSHISIYSGSTAQSLRIGGEEQLNGGLPAGITTKNKDKDGIKNGYSTFTVTLSPDTNTITLKVSNAEDESTFTGKFPEGSSYDLGALNFSTTHTWASRSCYVDDISVTKTTAPSYTMSFDVQDTSGEKIDKAAIEVTDAKYGIVIEPETDGTYYLCDGVYSYTVTAEGYEPIKAELELSQATLSRTIAVTMEKSGSTDPDPTPTSGPSDEKTATITIQYRDEEDNKIKDDVVFTEKYNEGDTYTVSDDLKKDFTVKTESGLYNLYTINEERSQLEAPYEESMTLKIEFNNSAQYDYYEDFENYTIDTSNWHVQSGNSIVPTVETDASGYIKYSAGSSTTGGYMTFDEVNTETKTVHISADVKFTPATEAQSNGKIGNSQFAISNTSPSFSRSNITYGINSSCSGHIIVFEYNSGKTLAVNGNELSTDFIGDWMHLEADVNFSDKSASITVTNDSGLKAVFEDAEIYSSSFDGNIGSYYMRGAGAYGMVSADNITVKVTGDGGERVPDIESDINFKSVYAFGDSIVYGDDAPQSSFMRLIADDYAVDLNMMAKNGATVMPGSNSIISQVNNAPEEAPDFVVFDGYTNDAYGSADSDEFTSSGSRKDITQCYGEITPEGTEEFDTSGLFFYMHKKTSS